MDSIAVLIILATILLMVVVALTAVTLALVALARASRITRLETRLAALESRLTERDVPPPAALASIPTAPLPEPVASETAMSAAIDAEVVEPRPPTIQWELLIGQKALGWIAVLLGLFAAAFFLRYAYENNWIGPQGRVAIGEALGLGLAIAGLRYHLQGWRLFAQMLSACGIAILYLSTYSAFGFYQLLPHAQAGGFLLAVVALSMLAAVLYNSPAIALVALLGGFLSPVLLGSDEDSYRALFVYLAVLNAGIGFVTTFRGWPGLGSLALVLTQILFWTWFHGNYHPEKLGWAIGFQAVLFALYVVQDLGIQFQRARGARWESSWRMIANAVFWFAALFVMLAPDYREWMGTAALSMATLYAIVASRLLSFHGRYTHELLTAVALAVGFMALAVPLEAEARWVSMGWAGGAAALCWLSVRADARPLNAMAGVMAITSLWRVLIVDLSVCPDEPVWPIFNSVALPSLGVTGLLLLALVATRPYLGRMARPQRWALAVAALATLVVLWIVLSVDVYRYFDMRARLGVREVVDWRRLGQMSLSVLWTLYATALLAWGFRWRIAGLRWLAIAFYGVTIAKVLVLDMAGLMQLYRIVAFLVLAVFLGLAARVYQRLGRTSADASGSSYP